MNIQYNLLLFAFSEWGNFADLKVGVDFSKLSGLRQIFFNLKRRNVHHKLFRAKEHLGMGFVQSKCVPKKTCTIIGFFGMC